MSISPCIGAAGSGTGTVGESTEIAVDQETPEAVASVIHKRHPDCSSVSGSIMSSLSYQPQRHPISKGDSCTTHAAKSASVCRRRRPASAAAAAAAGSLGRRGEVAAAANSFSLSWPAPNALLASAAAAACKKGSPSNAKSRVKATNSRLCAATIASAAKSRTTIEDEKENDFGHKNRRVAIDGKTAPTTTGATAKKTLVRNCEAPAQIGGGSGQPITLSAKILSAVQMKLKSVPAVSASSAAAAAATATDGMRRKTSVTKRADSDGGGTDQGKAAKEKWGHPSLRSLDTATGGSGGGGSGGGSGGETKAERKWSKSQRAADILQKSGKKQILNEDDFNLVSGKSGAPQPLKLSPAPKLNYLLHLDTELNIRRKELEDANGLDLAVGRMSISAAAATAANKRGSRRSCSRVDFTPDEFAFPQDRLTAVDAPSLEVGAPAAAATAAGPGRGPEPRLADFHTPFVGQQIPSMASVTEVRAWIRAADHEWREERNKRLRQLANHTKY